MAKLTVQENILSFLQQSFSLREIPLTHRSFALLMTATSPTEGRGKTALRHWKSDD